MAIAESIGSESFRAWKPLQLDADSTFDQIEAPRGPEVEKKAAPPAFNLARELPYIQEQGEAYYDFFSKEALYYVMESYGRVPRVVYEHSIRHDTEGNPYLYIDALNKSARESYGESAMADAPDWYWRRAQRDQQSIISLEDQLKTAKDGDIFFETSPTEYNVSVEERERCGFGYQSFARLHQVRTNEYGQPILVSRAFREYLDEAGHEQLFKAVTGQDVAGPDLLGTVAPIRADLDLSDVLSEADAVGVQALIDDIYARTPAVQKIIPPENDLFYTTNDHVRTQFSRLEPWLTDIYALLLRGPDPDSVADWQHEVERQFHGWEMAMKALIHDPAETAQVADDIDSVEDGGSIRDFYMEMTYDPGSNSCGNGAGFGSYDDMGSTSYDAVSGDMSYLGLNQRFNERMGQKCSICGLSSADNHYHCIGTKYGGESCTKWFASEIDVKPEDRTKQCPDCGFKFNC